MTYADIKRRIREALSGRFEPEHVRPLIDVYWHVLLSAALLLVLIFCSFAAWQLFFTTDDSASTDNASMPALPLNRPALESALAQFQARQAQFEILKSQ